MTNKVIKAKRNLFEEKFFKKNFNVLTPRQSEDNNSVTIPRYKSDRDREKSLMKDFNKMNKKNKFEDRRRVSSYNYYSNNADQLESDDDTLTHRGQKLEIGEDFDEAPEMTFVNTELADKTEDHFGGIFEPSDSTSKISMSTKELLKIAHEKIEKQKSEDQKRLQLSDSLYAGYSQIRNALFSEDRILDLHNSLQYNFDNDYSELITNLKPNIFNQATNVQTSVSRNTYQNSRKSNVIDLENPTEPELTTPFQHTSTDILKCSIEEIDGVSKPANFIDINDLATEVNLEDNAFNSKLEIFSNDPKSLLQYDSKAVRVFTETQDNIEIYLKDQWWQEVLCLPMKIKTIAFDQLLNFYLSIPKIEDLYQSIFLNISKFIEYYPEIAYLKIKIILKKIVAIHINENTITLHPNQLLFLFLISKLYTPSTAKPLKRIASISFQFSLYLLNKCAIQKLYDECFTLCGLIYEFCSVNQSYSPEVASFFILFESLLYHQKNYFLTKLNSFLILLQCYMKIWSNLDNFSQIFSFVPNLLSFFNSSEEYSTLTSSKIYQEIKKLYSKEIVLTANNLLIKKPSILKQYDPEIITISNKKSDLTLNQKHKVLKRKHKREFKGAVKELRKDAHFCSRKQLSDVIQNDQDRQAKVKELFKHIANESGTLD